jgi:hypothetical protein
MVIALAERAPASTTAELAFELLLIVMLPELAVKVPVEVELTPGLVVADVLVEVAVSVISPVAELNNELR